MDEEIRTLSDAINILKRDTVNRLIIDNKEFVQVVRCKDCKFYLNSNETCELIDTRLHFYETDKVWAEDSFCSWGERKEDERN